MLAPPRNYVLQALIRLVGYARKGRYLQVAGVVLVSKTQDTHYSRNYLNVFHSCNCVCCVLSPVP